MPKTFYETQEEYIEWMLGCIQTSQELLEVLETTAQKHPSLTQEVGEVMASEREYLKKLQEELNVALVS